MPDRQDPQQAQVDQVAEKFQAFYDGLPDGEQHILAAVLQQGTGEGDVAGYIPSEPHRYIPSEPVRFSFRTSNATLSPRFTTKLTIPVSHTAFR